MDVCSGIGRKPLRTGPCLGFSSSVLLYVRMGGAQAFDRKTESLDEIVGDG